MKTTNSINLSIQDQNFIITKAITKESLDEIFSCECEGFVTSIENPMFENFEEITLNSTSNYLDKSATLTLKNPKQ